MNSVKTPKGTVLPLVDLKGKAYLMVAYRIQWMNEEVPSFRIDTKIIKHEKDESIVQAQVTLFSKDSSLYKVANATKREDSKGFADHLEKAETGAIGRALALLGFGTQFALADLDEGERIVDGPLNNPKPNVLPPRNTHLKGRPSEAQLKRLFAISKAANWDSPSVTNYMNEEFGVIASKDLTIDQYNKLCETIEKNPAKPVDDDDFPFENK